MKRIFSRRAARSHSFLKTSSAMALAAVPQMAFATCTPNPVQSFTTTVCTGTETNQLVVGTSNPQVQINSGASLTAPASQSAILVTTALLPAFNSFQFSTFNVNGSVNGGTANGIELRNALPMTNPTIIPSMSANIVVGPTGSITGQSGIVLIADPANPTGPISVYLTNQGTITGTGGTALLAPTSGRAGFSSIANQAGATISGALVVGNGNFNSITNRGLIDGAISAASEPGPGYTIDTSRGGAVTGAITLGAGNDTLIADYGTATNPIGSVTGTVNAGAGSDRLVLNFSRDTSLSAAIATPASFERMSFSISSNSTLTLASGYAPNGTIFINSNDFSYANGSLVNNTALTVNGPVMSASSYSVLNIVNNGAITSTLSNSLDAAVSISNTSFNNIGSISAMLGIGVVSFGNLTNSGTIMADGDGARVFQGIVTNSGSIRSNNAIGLRLGANQGVPATNTGTITGGTAGLEISGNTFSNAGTITGTNLGVSLNSYTTLNNQAGGVINGGIGNLFGGSLFISRVTNAGTINGNVSFANSGVFGSSNTAFIALAGGVVNGNLNLGNDTSFVTRLINTGPGQFAGVTGTVTGGGQSTLRYLVDQNASTTLGTASGIFRRVGYELTNNAVLTLTAPGISTLTAPLDLAGTGRVDITANLSSSNAPTLINITATPLLATNANGSIPANALDVTSRGNLTVTHDQPFTGPTAAVLLAAGSSFTNAGTIVVNDTVPLSGSPTLGISGTGTVINKGTISLNGGAAIGNTGFSFNSLSVTNSGMINQLAGGADGQGITGATTLNNSGSIITGGAAVAFANSSNSGHVTNSGTITSLRGPAITAPNPFGGQYVVTNLAGGTINGGTGQAAILLTPSATIDNAGTINGNVNLAFSPYTWYTPAGSSNYTNRGGTLNGNLTFGAGNDTFISRDGATGVTGTVDGGAGIDTFVRAFLQNATVDLGAAAVLPSTFERFGIGALGTATVTLTSAAPVFSGGVQLFGDGTIVNTVEYSGTLAPFASAQTNTVQLGQVTSSFSPTVTGSSLSFINQANILHGVIGGARNFTNSATIGFMSLGNPAVSLITAATNDFSFSNNGTIQSTGRFTNSGLAYGVLISQGSSQGQQSGSSPLIPTARIENSGTIHSGMNVALNASDFTFSNSGLITGIITDRFVSTPSVQLNLGQSYTGTTADLNASRASINNAGELTSGLSAYLSAQAVIVNNSGTMNRVGNSNALEVSQSQHSTTDQSQGLYGNIDQDSFAFTNTGTIGGSVVVNSAAIHATTANSGTITDSATQLIFGDTGPFQSIAASYFSNTLGSQRIAFNNTGTIAQNRTMSTGIVVEAVASSIAARISGFEIAGPAVAGGSTADVAFANTGMIRANGGGVYSSPNFNDPYAGASVPDFSVAFAPSIAVALAAASEGVSTINLTNGRAGVISANGTLTATVGSTTSVFADPSAIGSLAVLASADVVTITNDGTITGLRGGIIPANISVLIGGNQLYLPTLSANYIAGAIQTLNSSDTLTNSRTGVITGSIDLGALDDTLRNFGSITGDVFLRDGADTFSQAIGGTINGKVDGGSGSDLFVITSDGSEAANATMNLSQFTSFETTRQDAGTSQLSGTYSTGAFNVTGGRAIGLAGSVLTATNFNVSTGATFGSAGTVNGNVVVNGTLSPGASPGTMTINGNLALATGSNTVFELTPTVNDLLLVSGAVNIASGATLTLTGFRPILPGATLDLIVAGGGVTGSFSSVVKPASMAGLVTQNGGRLQVLGQFSTSSTSSQQANGTAVFLNGLLVNGQASAGLRAAIPALVNADASTNDAALALITPEAYASATQIGTENGLILTGAMRSANVQPMRKDSGLFAFMQGIGNWRALQGDPARGTSRASTGSGGLLGGIGYGSQGAWLSGFVGYLNGRQTITALGARTSSDGLVAGISGHYSLGGFAASATLAFDAGKAKTNRVVPGSGAVSSRYGLHSTALDVTLGYTFPLSEVWSVTPQFGYTHVVTTRDALAESGSAAFNLDVMQQRAQADFMDGELRFAGGQQTGSKLSPWISFGIRHQLNGTARFTSAALRGSVPMFAASGVGRKRDAGTVGAGFSWAASSRVSLFGSYRGEFGDAMSGHNVNLGLKLGF